MYTFIKNYYNEGFYNNTPGDPMYVGNFVTANWITEEEYKEITGVDYTPA